MHPAASKLILDMIAAQLPLNLDREGLKSKAGIPAGTSTLWAWISAGKFPKPTKIAGKAVWKTSEILAWLDEQAQQATATTESRGAKLTAVRLAKRHNQAAMTPVQEQAGAHVCASAMGAAE